VWASTPYEVWVVEVPQYPQLAQDALRLGHLREDLRYLLDRHLLVRLAGSARRPHLAICGTLTRERALCSKQEGRRRTCAASDVVEQLVALQAVGPHSSEELGVRGLRGVRRRGGGHCCGSKLFCPLLSEGGGGAGGGRAASDKRITRRRKTLGEAANFSEDSSFVPVLRLLL
jgi:hypothetical protein